MTVNESPPILICAGQPSTLAELRHLLSGVGRQWTEHLFGEAEPHDAGNCQLIVIDGSPAAAALDLCRRLRERLGEHFVPILYLSEDAGAAARLASFAAGADTYLARPLAVGEVLAQARALLRIKDIFDRFIDKISEVPLVNKRLQQLHQQLDRESRLALQVQARLRTPTLPAVPRCRFAVHSPGRRRVGGDFHNIFRLDENHVGLYVADAMSHGVVASLLSVFVRDNMNTKEILDNKYHLNPPEEVLRQLNKDVIDLHLCEQPFLTLVYALYNHRDGVFRFARAGHPCPLYIPRQGQPAFWRQEGLLLGIVDAVFPARTYSLGVGDKVLLYSDGIDGGCFDNRAAGADSLLACAARHRHLPVGDFVERLVRDLFAFTAAPDDVTLLALGVCD